MPSGAASTSANPLTSLGRKCAWRDLAVGFTLKGLARWEARVTRLRSGEERWSVGGRAKGKKVAGLTMIELPFGAMEDWKRGVYLLDVWAWPGPGNEGQCRSAKTFEVIP